MNIIKIDSRKYSILNFQSVHLLDALTIDVKTLFLFLSPQAAVWMRYAECLSSLGETDSAVEAYQRVVEVAPQHHEARLYLSALLQQLGRQEEALLALDNGLLHLYI